MMSSMSNVKHRQTSHTCVPEPGPRRASSCRRGGEERSVSVIDSCGRGDDGDAPAAAVTKTQPAARMNPLSSSALDLAGRQGEV